MTFLSEHKNALIFRERNQRCVSLKKKTKLIGLFCLADFHRMLSRGMEGHTGPAFLRQFQVDA